MRKTKLSTISSLILLVIIVSSTAFAQLAVGATAAPTAPVASQIKIFAGPASVPADNQAYSTLSVQLQDAKGVPARAKDDVCIRLSSSLTNVGTADETVTIPAGHTQAVAQFQATYTPGTTTITATASGFSTVKTTVATVAPIPTTLAVYGFPPVLPADGNSYDAIIIQLQDSSGAPAKAPVEGVQISLSSSSIAAAEPNAAATIEAGQTYTKVTVKTGVPGTATVTATATGYSTSQTTVTTQALGSSPAKLKVYLAAPKLPADGSGYQEIAIELQDAKGKLAQAPDNVVVSLSTSNTAVGSLPTTVTITPEQIFGSVEFTTSYKAGTTCLTATATNFTANQATITTVGPIPTKLAVYSLPPTLPADGKAYEAVQVQLQDSRGKPAQDPTGDITVYLTSSVAEMGNVTPSVTIPFGQTQAIATFQTTCAANATTITANTNGYDTGQAKITTSLIDTVYLNVTVTAESSVVKPGNQTVITAYVAFNGTIPAIRANLNFTSSKGGNFSAVKDEGNGYYTTTFTAPKATKQTACIITANATKTGVPSSTGKTTVTVDFASTLVLGTFQLRVLDDGGHALNQASITSKAQPTGVQAVTATTNSSGLATFSNISEGNYTLEISKSGYETKTQTVQFSTKQTAAYQTLKISGASAFTLPVILGIVAAAVVASLVVFLFIRKRRNAAKTPANTEGQNQTAQTPKPKRQKKTPKAANSPY